MLSHQLLEDEGILIVEPRQKLQKEDFAKLASVVDPWVERNGDLRGLVIKVEHFPGWSDFAALVGHLRFVQDHHRKIARVAAVTDSRFLEIAPRVASHFVHAEVKHFDYDQADAAMDWIRSRDR